MLKVPSLSLSALCLRLVVVAFCVGLFACDDSEETGETISLNCAGEVDSGSTTISISGYAKDGKTGSKLSGAVNLYNSTGNTLLDNSSVSSSSKYSFSNLTPSTYVLKSVITDYVSVADKKCITSSDSNKDLIALTAADANNANVIVLTWSGGPNDLDSYLVASGGNASPTTIYYNNKGSSSAWAILDKDATKTSSNCTTTTNCPPETITINLDSSSGPMRNSVTKACYYVHNFTGSRENPSTTSFSQTNAQLQLFQSDGTLLTNFNTPTDTTKSKLYWHVFDLDSNLNITIKNSFSAGAPSCS
jgi:hypothetical protein